jgi:hypothetical protein
VILHGPHHRLLQEIVRSIGAITEAHRLRPDLLARGGEIAVE